MLAPPRGALISYSVHFSTQLYVYIVYIIGWISEIDRLLYDVIAESMTSSFLCNLHWSGGKQPVHSAYASRCRHRRSLQIAYSQVPPTSPNSRLGVHRLRFEISPWRHVARAWRHPENRVIFSSAHGHIICKKDAAAWIWTLDFEL